MSRAILVTGATGRQGSAVIDAILARNPSDLVLLAVTRNIQSIKSRSLATKSPFIKLVEGSLDSIPALFESAAKAAGSVPLWGVYSVQVSVESRNPVENEIRQGCNLVDEAMKAGVKHFVYSSGERGGDEASWDNPTIVPHIKGKHAIEVHLRDSVAKTGSSMGWTILRPVGFMENLSMGFASKLYLTCLRDSVGETPLQWVATKDIGFFAAEAFSNPEIWNKRAFGIAGDELTFSDLDQVYRKVTGDPAPVTFGILGKALRYIIPDIGVLFDWYRDGSFGTDLAKVKDVHPGILTFEGWLKNGHGG